MKASRWVLVACCLVPVSLTHAAEGQSVSLRVNVKPGQSYAYNCSYDSKWQTDDMPVDTRVTRTGRMVVKVNAKKEGVFSLQNQLTGWRTTSITHRDSSNRSDLVAKSREKDAALDIRVTSLGQILDTYSPDDWRSALSVVLPYPAKVVRVGDRWTSSLPVAPGTYSSNRKVVYEVFERRNWEGHDVLAVQFTSEPSRTATETMNGLVYIDTKTGLTLKGQFKNIIDIGNRKIQVEIGIELDK